MRQLYESILDVEGVLNNNDDLKSVVQKFLTKNYKFDGVYTIKYDKKTKKHIVNTRKNIFVKNTDITSLTNGLFAFGKCKGFNCSECKNLTSLEGAPQDCETFICNNCKKLESLEGVKTDIVYCKDTGRYFLPSYVKHVTGASKMISNSSLGTMEYNLKNIDINHKYNPNTKLASVEDYERMKQDYTKQLTSIPESNDELCRFMIAAACIGWWKYVHVAYSELTAWGRKGKLSDAEVRELFEPYYQTQKLVRCFEDVIAMCYAGPEYEKVALGLDK